MKLLRELKLKLISNSIVQLALYLFSIIKGEFQPGIRVYLDSLCETEQHEVRMPGKVTLLNH